LLQRMGGETSETEPIDNAVADPIRHLKAIYRAVLGWPAALAQDMQWSAVRRTGMVFMGDRCARIHRTIIESGVSPDQLQSLDEASINGLLADELSLITRELAWRWTTNTDDDLPESLATWVDKVEAVCADLVDRSSL
jgi:hypothetical protein